jgi:hypothetical protein
MEEKRRCENANCNKLLLLILRTPVGYQKSGYGFTCPLCQHEHLSQWRAYAGPSSGFALGLRSTYLREAAHSQGFYLVPCVYTVAEQQNAIDQMIGEFRDRMTTSAQWELGQSHTDAGKRSGANRIAQTGRTILSRRRRSTRQAYPPRQSRIDRGGP